MEGGGGGGVGGEERGERCYISQFRYTLVDSVEKKDQNETSQNQSPIWNAKSSRDKLDI